MRRVPLALLLVTAGLIVVAGQTPADQKLQSELKQLFPGAAGFSPKEGSPPHYTAFMADRSGAKTPLGFAFWTTDLEPLERGYDGPIKMIVGMDTKGVLTGVIVVEHHEPYGDFSIEPPAFATQFRGKSIRDASGSAWTWTPSPRNHQRDEREPRHQEQRPPRGARTAHSRRREVSPRPVKTRPFLLPLTLVLCALGIVASLAGRAEARQAQPSRPVAAAPAGSPAASAGAPVAAQKADPFGFSEDEDDTPTLWQIIRGQALNLSLLTAFTALALVGFFRKNETLKTITLVASVAYLGFYKSALITIVNVYGLLSWNLPTLRDDVLTYFVFVFMLA